MALSPAVPETWDEDPAGVSILLATGRARHDLLVVCEPQLLTELDAAWGPSQARVRLSFLPGVLEPRAAGQEDALLSYDRGGLGVLVARGRTCLHEGHPARSTTALARIVAGSGARAALLVTRASSVGGAAPGDLLAVGDHVSLSGTPLFPSERLLQATWDEDLTARVSRLPGVRGTGVVALGAGPLRPTPTEARILAGMGVDAVVTDTVAEGMALAGGGVSTAALVVIDDAVGPASQPSGRRAAPAGSTAQQPAAVVVHEAVEAVLAWLARHGV
ncbi:purine-nucleoside phosphorylase [Actinomyces wuliandei]|uniref:purine-nucleoside phosphorylase n=1 Tax=Actinomyces wuliandei TaxID=2057743 RepID=UPI000FD9A507|nr:purine-nucleoside phosphorylase [Actinomyces wuliandei]